MYVGDEDVEGVEGAEGQLFEVADCLDEDAAACVVLCGHVAEAQLGVRVDDSALVELFRLG